MKRNRNFKVLFSISGRNTLRQPRRSLLLGGAIAFSVLVISLAMGFTAGMEKSVQDNVTLYSAGHILINGYARSESGRAQNRISDQSLAETVGKDLPQALSVSPTAQAQANVVFGSREQQLRLRGVDWSTDKLFSGSLVLKQGDWQSAKAERSMILGAQSAKRFGLGLGDSLLVRLSTFSGQQNVVEYKLGAVYDDASAGGMSTAIVPLADLQQDLNLPKGEFQTLAVFLPDAAASDAAAAALQKSMAGQGFLLAPSAQAMRQAASEGGQAGQSGQPAAAQTGQAAQSAAVSGGQAAQVSGSVQGNQAAAGARTTYGQGLSAQGAGANWSARRRQAAQGGSPQAQTSPQGRPAAALPATTPAASTTTTAAPAATTDSTTPATAPAPQSESAAQAAPAAPVVSGAASSEGAPAAPPATAPQESPAASLAGPAERAAAPIDDTPATTLAATTATTVASAQAGAAPGAAWGGRRRAGAQGAPTQTPAAQPNLGQVPANQAAAQAQGAQADQAAAAAPVQAAQPGLNRAPAAQPTMQAQTRPAAAAQTRAAGASPAAAGRTSPGTSAGGTAAAGQAQGPTLLIQGQGGQQGAEQGGGPGGFGRGLFFGGMNIPEGKTLYRVSTITQLSGQVGAVLGSVRWIGVAIFLIMLVLTATGITNTYRMVLLERTKEIGMMRCIGFKRRQIFWVFLFESALLAVAGSLAGIALSFPIGWLIHAIPFNPSGELAQALSGGRLVYAPGATTLLIVAAAVLAASVTAVYWPARKASQLQPVEAIRQTA